MARTIGRFNFLTVKNDKFEVIFKPMVGHVITIIAKDLSREEAIALMNELNAIIDDFRNLSFEEFKKEDAD